MLMLISMISSSVCLIENMLRFNVNFNDDDDFVCFVVNMLMLILMLISLMMTFNVCLVVNMLMQPNEPALHASLPSLRLSLHSYISK